VTTTRSALRDDHYAEHKAKLPGKRIYPYRRLMPGDCFERIALRR
jgi:hypothetical protein